MKRRGGLLLRATAQRRLSARPALKASWGAAAGTAGLTLALIAGAHSALAAVTSVEVTERGPFAPGVSFGRSGPYEVIRGVAHFALDPDLKANAPVVDLQRAPRDADRRVAFSAEFVLLRPVKPHAGATLLYDVNNRGSIAAMGQLEGASPANNAPSSAADAGDGFLWRHGFSLLASAWTWDVAPPPPGGRPLVLHPPVAVGPGGQAIRGRVANEFIVSSPQTVAVYAGMRGLTYPPLDHDAEAVLTQRLRPGDPRRPVPSAQWRFEAAAEPGGPGRIRLEGGFQPGVIYEVAYLTEAPYVAGAGLAGVRDLLAWFRDHPFLEAPPPTRTLIFGISQSARVIGRMLHDGLDVGEDGRLVFDGAYLQVPGAGGSAGFNSRFSQPTRHPSMLEEHDYPADAFPFTTARTEDPVTGAVGSILDHAADLSGRSPRLIIANTSTEFWNRGASLGLTTPDGRADAPPAPGVRVYALMGAQHYVGRSSQRAPYQSCVSTTDHYLVERALLLALEQWTAAGPPPPPSAYPTLASGDLITVQAYARAFPNGFGLTPPQINLREPRLDFGPEFDGGGVAAHVPPIEGAAFETRVPAPDGDGNDRGGVRMVELQAPLGTHTGWNLRAPETGFPFATARFDGSFAPFARTEAERRARGDPRPSLAARYGDRAGFEAAARAAAARQMAAGFLLAEDAPRAISEALGLYDRILAHDPDDRSCAYLFPAAAAGAS